MSLPSARIRTRLLVWVSSLLLVSLTAVNLLFVLLSRESARDQAHRQLASVASLKEDAILTWRTQLSRSIQAIRVRVGLGPGETRPSGAVLAREMNLENLFEELFVTDLKGRILVSTLSENEGKIVSDKPYFPGLVTFGYVSSPFYDLTTQTLRVVAAAPVTTSTGEKIGTLAGVANLAVLDRVMAQRTGLGLTGETFLVGANGTLVTPSRWGSRNDLLRLAGVDRAFALKGTVESDFSTPVGPTLADSRWIATLNVVLVADQDQAEVEASARTILTVNLWLEGFLVLLALGAALLVSRGLVRPLDDLAETALGISGGSLERRAREDGPREIAVLGRAFNTMTTRLRDSIHELTAYQANLETVVAQRTEALGAALVRAEESDRLKSSFLATMSHELRTPLNSIIGFTGILSQGLVGPINDEQRKQLGFVMTSARHLLDLISDILDISKIEAGELKVERTAYDLPSVVGRAVKSIEPLAGKKNLALVCTVSPGAGAMVGDPRRVEQVLLNLLSNAVKFTETGTVTVVCEVLEAAVQIAVSDTGAGIRPGDLEKLFRPFQQLDAGLNRLHQGTGLGLSICKRLVELMGGTITATSTPGQGSTFSFTLPLEKTL